MVGNKTAGTTIVAGLSAVAASSLAVPKVRKKAKKELPQLSKVMKRADSPSDLKDEAEAEVKDELTSKLQEKFQDSLQSMVHSKAKNMEKKAQEGLLQVRSKLANIKEAGEEFQSELKGSNSKKLVPGANDIKGVSSIKSSANIKSSTNIKGPQHIKHHS